YSPRRRARAHARAREDGARHPAAGADRAGDDARRGDRCARGTGHRRALLVHRRVTSGPAFNVRDALAPSTMTALRRQTVFAGLDQPESWPATRGRPQSQRLERELDGLPGVGATLKRKLPKLGLV